MGRRDVVWRYIRTKSGVSTSAHTTANPNNTSTVGFLTWSCTPWTLPTVRTEGRWMVDTGANRGASGGETTQLDS